MASLISTGLRASVRDAFQNIHDTFATNIYYSKKGETILLGENPDYIFGYEQTASVSGYVSETGLFSGRIAYTNRYSPRPVDFNNFDFKNEVYRGEIRMRVDASGLALLKNNESIRVNNGVQDEYYEIFSDPRPHGFFAPPTWYDVFLKKSS